MPGAQPTGVVRVWKEREPCAGHRECGSYVLHYTFDSGVQPVQGPQHPDPGIRASLPGHGAAVLRAGHAERLGTAHSAAQRSWYVESG